VRHALSSAVVLTLGAVLAASCDKVPLLAPTGTVITLFPTASTVAVDGNVEIIATVIENGVASTTTSGAGTGSTAGTGTATTTTGTTTTTSAGAGTPVQNGTLVSFTTTIGRIEPSEARTTNGQVRVRFIAAGQSGTATITAYSGGASGKIENLLVGTAAAERLILTASPQTLSASGGAAVVSARVENTSGQGVSGVPVNFTADAGTLSSSTANTDQNGVASVTLNTTRQSVVTANVAGKTATVTVGLNPRTGVILTAPSTPVAAGQPATFGISVAATANIRDVRVDFGDGRSISLGALSGAATVSHTYAEPGTYTVRATAVDASGFTETVTTSITVLPAQPPSVLLSASPTRPVVGVDPVTFSASVSGNTSTIRSYTWDFGDGTRVTTTSPQIQHVYETTGAKTVTVTVNQASGPSGQTQVAIVVVPVTTPTPR
jgi:PKD repeat protein